MDQLAEIGGRIDFMPRKRAAGEGHHTLDGVIHDNKGACCISAD